MCQQSSKTQPTIGFREYLITYLLKRSKPRNEAAPVLNPAPQTESYITGSRSWQISVEYFYPLRLVSYEQIWNRHLVDASSSSRKNNKLPRMGDYYDGNYRLQKTAIKVMTVNYPKEPMMENYLSLFPSSDAQQLQETDLR